MPRRRWFQFHLSTLLVLMLAAGGLMWLNFRPREHWMVYRIDLPAGDSAIEIRGRHPRSELLARRDSRYGWPFPCCTESHDQATWTSTEPIREMTIQQVKELDELPNQLEYELDHILAVAPSLVDWIDFEAELDRKALVSRRWFRVWSWKPLVTDSLVAVALLIGLALSCEFLARRRTGTNESADKARRISTSLS